YQDILAYLEAILRVYNRHGRRDNKYKARIKILVKALGVDAFREKVEAEFELLKGGSLTLDAAYVEKMAQYFTKPAYEAAENLPQVLVDALDDKTFKRWYQRNVNEHMQTGYAIVTVNTKETARAPGDVSDYELEQLADLADRYCFGQIRSTHDQNFVLADVRQDQLPELYATLKSLGFADPTIGLINDIICCPGGDFCALANAKSIPIAESIQRQFDDLDYVFDIGELELNISGCMNACGHHHVGNIGILGVDKKGEEFYQIQLGGNSGLNASLAKVLGPALTPEEMPSAIQTLIDVFLEHRQNDERFIDTYERIGIAPFKERIYAKS
ncbi:MAG: nitrite/sulfite reductase, partial [Pseudomonadota bacterium]|nr:nitrite/sulfite reductase [Pseudomonadota bacterium]